MHLLPASVPYEVVDSMHLVEMRSLSSNSDCSKVTIIPHLQKLSL
jgi:hypothetical protein